MKHFVFVQAPDIDFRRNFLLGRQGEVHYRIFSLGKGSVEVLLGAACCYLIMVFFVLSVKKLLRLLGVHLGVHVFAFGEVGEGSDLLEVHICR
jgi:hypothetical protein